VILVTGVNGSGKTTSIAKLARIFTREGKRVVLGAGDTFRAAAVEQLTMWAERAGADLVRGNEGGDPASVIFDATERARSRHADVVMGDTAGRLHNKSNLMEELKKVRRVAEKGAGTVTEVLLVLDATTGQNGLIQAKEFTDTVELTGVVLTKLDGSAKGGIVLAISRSLPADVPRHTLWVVNDLLWVNFGWGMLNLLPMLPLDGGNVLLAAMERVSPMDGARATHKVSAVVAAIAGVAALHHGMIWGAMLAAWMGYNNYKALRQRSAW